MSGEKRRENLLKILQASGEPVSGTKLAEKFQVSRQVVVQDIALLRAANHDIVSTHKGYVLQDKKYISRVFKVKHSVEKMLEELNLIVDCGGKVEDVFVYHKLYNVVRVPMNIRSRMDAKKYVDSIQGGVSVPLEQITSEYHYHRNYRKRDIWRRCGIMSRWTSGEMRQIKEKFFTPMGENMIY